MATLAKVSPFIPIFNTIHQGGELLLQCQADGVPAPLLSWVLPDRSALTSAAPSADRIFMDTNGTLHISVTLPSDRGMYRCVASNSAGAASASVRVHVSSLPPVIQQPREEHLLLSPGRPVYAHCSARGAPPPTLRWRIPDGTLVRPSQFLHGNLFVLPNGTLHIRRVGSKDSGSYECTASNAVGADKRTVRVEIEGGAGKEEGKALLVIEVLKTLLTHLWAELFFCRVPPKAPLSLVWPGFCPVTECCQLLTTAVDSLCTETAPWSCGVCERVTLGHWFV
uniref:Matrix-remodeling-associated protein 5-like n=1 Tax=Seriola lalandi dorsalis TaxID=1841481 RepID=A0A3B4XDN8_SERLL